LLERLVLLKYLELAEMRLAVSAALVFFQMRNRMLSESHGESLCVILKHIAKK